MKYVICGIVHGVQAFGLDRNAITEFSNKIRDKIPNNFRDYFVSKVIDWDRIAGARQEEALEMERDLPNWIDRLALKKKLIQLKHRVGSDIMFEFPAKSANGMNWIAQQEFDMFEETINSEVRKHKENCYVTLIGHSWGGQKALRYCFDSTYPISGLVTMGSPITAVSGAWQDWGKLPPALQFWLNIRAAGDWIGSVFKNHKSVAFKEFVKDFFISSWNPKKWTTIGAHTSYWTSDSCIEKIANTIITQFFQ